MICFQYLLFKIQKLILNFKNFLKHQFEYALQISSISLRSKIINFILLPIIPSSFSNILKLITSKTIVVIRSFLLYLGKNHLMTFEHFVKKYCEIKQEKSKFSKIYSLIQYGSVRTNKFQHQEINFQVKIAFNVSLFFWLYF